MPPTERDEYDPRLPPDVPRYGGYAYAQVGSADRTSMKWVFGILASVVGGIVIIQLQFFGSAVIEQGKIVARMEERLTAMNDTVKAQGETYARDRENFTARINSLEQRTTRSGGDRNRQ